MLIPISHAGGLFMGPQAMDDDEMDTSVTQLRASDEAARQELANRLPIPANAPLVPGFDRYGFMENDVLASGSEALLRRIEKKVRGGAGRARRPRTLRRLTPVPMCVLVRPPQQKEEEYLKYETTQRIAFDTFLAKKGQHLDALSRSDELKVLVRNGVPRDYRAHVRVAVACYVFGVLT